MAGHIILLGWAWVGYNFIQQIQDKFGRPKLNKLWAWTGAGSRIFYFAEAWPKHTPPHFTHAPYKSPPKKDNFLNYCLRFVFASKESVFCFTFYHSPILTCIHHPPPFFSKKDKTRRREKYRNNEFRQTTIFQINPKLDSIAASIFTSSSSVVVAAAASNQSQ